MNRAEDPDDMEIRTATKLVHSGDAVFDARNLYLSSDARTDTEVFRYLYGLAPEEILNISESIIYTLSFGNVSILTAADHKPTIGHLDRHASQLASRYEERYNKDIANSFDELIRLFVASGFDDILKAGTTIQLSILHTRNSRNMPGRLICGNDTNSRRGCGRF